MKDKPRTNNSQDFDRQHEQEHVVLEKSMPKPTPDENTRKKVLKAMAKKNK